MNELQIHIEALLFALGRPLSRAELKKYLNVSSQELDSALKTAWDVGERGIVLVDDGKVVELRSSPASASLIEAVRKDEFSREIGRAGLETLSAILYRGSSIAGIHGLTRSEIDFIRGVNSSQILRTLTIRGLLRKVPNPKDERSFLYEPTTELLAHLGVAEADELPDFDEFRSKLQKLEVEYRLNESQQSQIEE